MANSSKAAKPKKPRPDFPLYAHASGRWAKKVRGKTHYFGPWIDPQAALEKWVDQKDDLLAGRTPRPVGIGRPTVADLCNSFLTHKQQLVTSGGLAERTFNRYPATCGMLVASFGRRRLSVRMTSKNCVAL